MAPVLHRNTLALVLPGLLITLGLLMVNNRLAMPGILVDSKYYLPWFFILPAVILAPAFRL
ncbi:MAG: hypothetical protein OEY07_10165, partial [Gammaproteobacteria bacterium]|nr:hypothetical protein [Gammaproteobacteria bacterium]